jgi:hypothetical protein
MRVDAPTRAVLGPGKVAGSSRLEITRLLGVRTGDPYTVRCCALLAISDIGIEGRLKGGKGQAQQDTQAADEIESEAGMESGSSSESCLKPEDSDNGQVPGTAVVSPFLSYQSTPKI